MCGRRPQAQARICAMHPKCGRIVRISHRTIGQRGPKKTKV
ncbi:hypothetical protein HRUBRA_02353 [Pseudohaliea rubra DSM 19751]|uniref:Uncharacterized protein n=1 Tax=Pseudohaliea rubra DSM 19751 TaxID=1265313 RepID=A0A095XU01_9GAMM|nr:hypothetical protein HRUBRA_02353 [Pseudohaliea rubra DSM 19751]